MMRLEPHGPDTFIGTGPSYPWGGLYGGQIVAQALRAAADTVDPAFQVHSLHASFIRPGDAAEPIRLEVDRLRDGRSFLARSIVARQSNGAILNMFASFQLVRAGSSEALTPGRTVPAGPEGVADHPWGRLFDRRPLDEEPGHSCGWLRVPDLTDDDPVLAACAIAFLSDDLAADAVRSHLVVRSSPTEEPTIFGTSLDHAIWYRHPISGGGWQLYEYRSDGPTPPRGLALGHVYSVGGRHLATVAQEVLLRTPPW